MELYLALNMTLKWLLFLLMTSCVCFLCALKFLFFVFASDLRWFLFIGRGLFRDLDLDEVYGLGNNQVYF